MNPLGHGDIFQRIYQDVLEIKQELKRWECPEHEWIDFEDVKRTELEDEQYVVEDDLNLKDEKK